MSAKNAAARFRTVTEITLPRAKRPKRSKTGCARGQLTTLYPSLSLASGRDIARGHPQSSGRLTARAADPPRRLYVRPRYWF